MPQFNLKNDETEKIDIGNSSGVSATNVSTVNAKFHVDHLVDGKWSSITGEINLKPGEHWGRTRVELGHDHVRVGAKGLDDGTVIIEGRY